VGVKARSWKGARQPRSASYEESGTLAEPIVEKVLYVAGSGRSGTTALSLLLNNHPAMVAISEIDQISRIARPGFPEPCTCEEPIESCPFWNKVAAEFARLTSSAPDPTFQNAGIGSIARFPASGGARNANAALLVIGNRRLLAAAARVSEPIRKNLRAAEQSHIMFRAIRNVTGRSVVVDASKKGVRMKTLHLERPDSVRVVQMVRDGRGVAWSRINRLGDSMDRAARYWVRGNLGVEAMIRGIPKVHRILLHYEDLCRNPLNEVRRIERLLDLPPSDLSLDLDKNAAHFIGGNPMRYRASEKALALDEQWRNHLDSSTLHEFDRVAGWLNRRYGYGK
jgi:hypothetical protein